MHEYISVRGHRLEFKSWIPAGALDHHSLVRLRAKRYGETSTKLEERSRGGRGSSSTPAILLLHEGLGSVSAWRSFPADLAERTGWRVVAYSRRGYGASDAVALPRPVSFMHDEAIDELPHVLDALELTRPVILGHSDGGSIALIVAAHHPERTRALILEAPHVFVEDISVASIARMKVAYETRDLRARLARFHGDNVDIAFRGWNDVWLNPDFRAWNIEALLPRVHCPTLIIQGENDEYGTLAQVDAISRQVGGPTHIRVLTDCGHAPHHAHRGPVLDEIDGFLRTLLT